MLSKTYTYRIYFAVIQRAYFHENMFREHKDFVNPLNIFRLLVENLASSLPCTTTIFCQQHQVYVLSAYTLSQDIALFLKLLKIYHHQIQHVYLLSLSREVLKVYFQYI